MALDECHEDDELIDIHGFPFVIDRQLYQVAKPIRVTSDLTDKEFPFLISSTILENTCSMAENVKSCKTTCMA